MELKDTIEEMLSEDYKERFIAEYKQLIIRLKKLQSLIVKAIDNKLEFELTCNVQLLKSQMWYMKSYAEILRQRAKKEGIDLGGIR